MSYSINIFYADQIVGTLQQDKESGLLNIIYKKQWQQNGFPLSPHLNLDNNFSTSTVYNFLDNQLPEGDARKLLAQELGVNEKQVFPQIRAIGNDLSGAINFTSSENNEREQAIFRIIPTDEMVHRLDNRESLSLIHWDDKPRLSVAGVQEKLNVFINPEDNIGFGDGLLCSTHLLKFERKNCPNLVLNEYICMKLSNAINLPTAAVEFKRFGKHPALLVTRFDRKYDAEANKVLRRHIIDGCQALNLPRDYKYERNLGDERDVKNIRDGASLEKLFSLCKSTPTSITNIQWLINWQLFNLIINNYDSHGKNVSFFFGNNIFEFTLAYDLVNISLFKQFKHVLAMAMGDEFDPDTINAYQLADFAETCHLDKKLIMRSLLRLVNSVLRELDTLKFIDDIFDEENPLFDNNDRKYANLLINNIRTNANHLKKEAPEIVNITV